MKAALQVYHTAFDLIFFKLPPPVQTRIETRIDGLGLQLDTFSHRRLKGSTRDRLRVGDYRIVYTFDRAENIVYLLAMGHRREIYR